MTNEEQAHDLALKIMVSTERWISGDNDFTANDARDMILAYAEKIRRECADRFCEHKCAWPPNEWEHPDECECTERFAILGKGI